MTTTTERLATGVWTADVAHSAVEFRVRHLGLSTVRGRFTEFAAELTVIDGGADASVTASIALASVSTGNDDRDAHLRSPDFFDVDSNPTMSFSSTSIDGDGERYRMVGDLTVGGITNPVELEVEFAGQATDSTSGTHRAGFSATGEISRKDFGIQFDVPLDGGGVLVGDKVKIELDLQFVAPSDED